MKASELRLGNYISDSIFTFTIKGIDDGIIKGIVDDIWNTKNARVEDFYKQGQFYSLNIENCIPIPLTEERFLKLGFTTIRKGNGHESKIDRFNLWKGFNWDYWTFLQGGYDAEDNDFHVMLQYVHQLQNLYYALAGEELEIKC